MQNKINGRHDSNNTLWEKKQTLSANNGNSRMRQFKQTKITEVSDWFFFMVWFAFEWFMFFQLSLWFDACQAQSEKHDATYFCAQISYQRRTFQTESDDSWWVVFLFLTVKFLNKLYLRMICRTLNWFVAHLVTSAFNFVTANLHWI